MYHVWANWNEKEKREKVASADSQRDALHYGFIYSQDTIVVVKKGNKIIAKFGPGFDPYFFGEMRKAFASEA